MGDLPGVAPVSILIHWELLLGMRLFRAIKDGLFYRPLLILKLLRLPVKTRKINGTKLLLGSSWPGNGALNSCPKGWSRLKLFKGPVKSCTSRAAGGTPF